MLPLHILMSHITSSWKYCFFIADFALGFSFHTIRCFSEQVIVFVADNGVHSIR